MEAQAPQIANCITFNGILTTNPVDVGGGYFAFNLIGKNKEEFPLILLKTSKEELHNNSLFANDYVAGVGFLKKMQEQWTIIVYQINRLPTEKEIEKMN